MEKWSSRFMLFLSWIGILIIVLLGCLNIFKFVPSAKREREFQRQKIAFLEKELAETERRLAVRREFLDRLNTDTEFLDRVARKRLKYVRPDDFIIRFDTDDED